MITKIEENDGIMTVYLEIGRASCRERVFRAV